MPLFTPFDRVVAQMLESLPVPSAVPSVDWSPDVDIVETRDAYTLFVDLPGVRAEAVTVSFDRGVLSVRGERAIPVAEQTRRWAIERPFGRFLRTARLGHGVDAEHITASQADGVLTVVVPKLAAAQSRTIAVSSTTGAAGSGDRPAAVAGAAPAQAVHVLAGGPEAGGPEAGGPEAGGPEAGGPEAGGPEAGVSEAGGTSEGTDAPGPEAGRQLEHATS